MIKEHVEAIFLFILALILSLVFIDIESKRVKNFSNIISYNKKEYVFPYLDNIYKIIIKVNKKKLIIEKGILNWKVEYLLKNIPILKDLGDEEKISQLIKELKELKILKKFKKEKYNINYKKDYKISNKYIRIFYGNLEKTLYIKELKNNIIAQIDDKNYYIIINSRIKYWLDIIENNPNSLRNIKIFGIRIENIKYLEYSTFKSKYTTIKIDINNKSENKSLKFKLSIPKLNLGNERGSFETCNKILNFIKKAKVYKFLFPHKFNLDLNKLNKYIIKLKVISLRDISETIVILDKKYINNTEFYLVAKLFENNIYYYLITNEYISLLPLYLKDIISPYVLVNFDINEIREIKRKGSIKWDLVKNKNNEWELIKPLKNNHIIKENVYKFLKNLLNLKMDYFKTYKEIKNKLKDLKPETLEIILNNKEIKLTFWITKEGEIIVNTQNENIYRIITKLNDKRVIFLKKHFMFYSNRVDAFIFINVNKVIIKRNKEKIVIEKRKKEWYITYPINFKADKEEVEDVLRDYAWIMADEVIGETEEHRKIYGTYKSEFQIQIITPQVNRKIEIGKNIEKKYCAIWISGFPYVYKVRNIIKKHIKKSFIYKHWINPNYFISSKYNNRLAKIIEIEFKEEKIKLLWNIEKNKWECNKYIIKDKKKIKKIEENIKKIKLLKLYSHISSQQNIDIIIIFKVLDKNNRIIKKFLILKENNEYLGKFSNLPYIFLVTREPILILLDNIKNKGY